MLHDVVIELMKDPDVAKYWIDLAHAKGIDPERAAAYAQGRDEGIREAIRVLLEERFGRLDAEFLAALDRTQGTALTEILLHSQKDNLEQVRERLDATGVA